MPYLHIRTNRPLTKEDQHGLLSKGAALVAQALGKPERYVMTSVESEVAMLFAASDDPCAYLELKSIGLPGDQTGALSRSLCQLITDELAIPGERIYIEFTDAPRHMWGWNNATF